jgi:hypothetical protein
MKKLLFILCTTLVLGCSKKNDKTCYECDLNSTGTYTQQGCYTDEEWNALNLTDFNGNPIDKNTHCRKK